MNALLLAAGKGTRLRPLTTHTPKCLVKVGGIALMDIWLAELWQAGFTCFLVNTHHLSNIVEAHLASHPLKRAIQTVFEDDLLGTAGTLAANRDFCMQGTTLIGHADNLCLCDWKQFLHAHATRPNGTIMTMMTFRTPTPQSCGIVQLDSYGVVKQFFEKSSTPPNNLASAAIYLMEPAVIELLLSTNPPMTDISTELIPALLGRINTWYNPEIVIDIGTEASLQYANSLCKPIASRHTSRLYSDLT